MKIPELPRNWRLIATLTIFAMGIAPGTQGAPQHSETQTAVAPKAITYVEPTRANYLKFADEAESLFRNDVLGVWFPRTINKENGGFYASFTRDWKPAQSEGKFSVFQARMTWMSAEVVMRRPDLKDQFYPYMGHGVDYLRNVFWDRQYGGFYWGLDDKGQISSFYSDGKHLYGNSFCLYALAAAYQATRDPKILDFAQKSFRWMDEHAHDAKNGGYFEWLTREGKPVSAHPETGKVELLPVALFPIGYKSMNTHIHLLESFTQLYEVWPDETLRKRLEELLAIIRDKISVEPGAMNLYLTNEWVALPDHDSYGHDVEAAYLLLETEDVLGHGHDPKTVRMAKMLVDHALAYGWDENLGGFYRAGTTHGQTEDRLKEWWVQVEGLNALLLMHDRYGQQTDVYFKAFQRQWQFIKENQLDPEYRGLYELVGPDGKPVSHNKGRIWKEAYHEGRAMMNVTARLHKLAEASAK